ncbi:MAG: GTP-binding protein [Clostridia bacterium]|nr:GTP-binding protein [Clostridia bacterium]
MTKIDIFSGFLGAGKTTLIKKLISEGYNGEKLVLIENEFGEIGIDGGFLKESGIEITEMNSGCICCSLVGDFGEALKKVLDQFSPDRILIEPSGVGKLSDVINAVEVVLNDNVVLNSATAVVDASKCKMYMKNFGEFFNNQIEHAGCIILSRTDITSSEKVAKATELIREKNPSATIVTTSINDLSGKDILAAMEGKETLETLKQLLEEKELCPVCGHHHHEEHCECGHEHHHHDEHCECGHEHHHHDEHCDCGHEHHHHDEHCNCGHEHHHHDEHCDCGHEHHHADEVFVSCGFETGNIYTKEEIENILEELEDSKKYGAVLRAKGYVNGVNGWVYFDYVPGQSDVRLGSPAVTGRICVIGSGLDEQAIETLFHI